MKNRNLLLGLLVIIFSSIYSCDSDPCDEGYTQVEENGATFCLPDYLVGVDNPTENGDRFYHSKYGIIKYDNAEWINKMGENITELLKVKQ